jgi:hypothetical protein
VYAKYLIGVFLVVVSACTSYAENEAVIYDDKVAGVKVGGPVDSVYALYSENRIQLVNLTEEAGAYFLPGLHLYFADSDKPSLEATIGYQDDHFIVSLIKVYDTRFTTEEGIRPGMTVGEAKEHYKVRDYHFAEGRLRVSVVGFAGEFVSQYEAFPVGYIFNRSAPLDDAFDELLIEYIIIGQQTH